MHENTPAPLTVAGMAGSTISGVLAVAEAAPWWLAALGVLGSVALPLARDAFADWLARRSDRKALLATIGRLETELAALRARVATHDVDEGGAAR